MYDPTLMSFVSPELIESYQKWTGNAVAQLHTLAKDWKEARRSAEASRAEIHEIAHNIKGMGTSFGHPLMTDAGRSLADFLRLKPDVPDELAVIEAHIAALEHILALGPGEHDDMRERLIAPLHLLTGLETTQA